MTRLASLSVLLAGACGLSAQQPAYTPPAAPAVAVPLYGLVHVPADAADLTELRRQLADLMAEVKALRSEVQSLRPPAANTPAPKKAANTGPSALSVVQARCAGCHGQDTAADKGGGLELVRGTVLGGGDAETARQIVAAVRAGTMPPPKKGGTLSPAEKSAILAQYDRGAK